MGFKELSSYKEGNAISAKEIAVGDSVEGHLVRFIKTSGKFGESISPVLRNANGEDTVVWAAGNIKYLENDLKSNDLGLGVMIRITSVKPDPKSNYKNYFKFEFNETDVLELDTPGEDQGEY